MAIKIFPEEVWLYFMENKTALSSAMHMIADNEETKTEIYITEEYGLPHFSIDVNGLSVYRETAISRPDAEDSYRRLIDTYLCSKPEKKEKAEASFTAEDDDRRDELLDAGLAFFQVLLGEDAESEIMQQSLEGELGELIEDMVLEAGRYLHDEYGFSIYHPIIENGELLRFPFDEEE